MSDVIDTPVRLSESAARRIAAVLSKEADGGCRERRRAGSR